MTARESEQPQGPGSHGRENTASVTADGLSEECQNVQMAERMLAARRLRNEEFDHALFGEPAWDMLLELYVRESSGASSTAAQLQEASGAPPSIAERWLRALEENELLLRHTRASYSGTAFVELTRGARQALERYLAAARNLPLPQAPSLRGEI